MYNVICIYVIFIVQYVECTIFMQNVLRNKYLCNIINLTNEHTFKYKQKRRLNHESIILRNIKHKNQQKNLQKH